jgi:hypothetical protein
MPPIIHTVQQINTMWREAKRRLWTNPYPVPSWEWRKPK